jgi:hypothetical protein
MASLNDIQKKNPFKVPENYFEEVNRKILSAAVEVSPQRNKVLFIHRFRTQLAVAASITGLVLLSYAGLKIITHDRANSKVSEVFSLEEKESMINDIDILTLEENLSSSELPAETSELTNKEIIDYLLLENIEITDIYEKL